MTTVDVKEGTWRQLHGLKDPGESMDDVISSLLEESNRTDTTHDLPTEDAQQ